jgi:hypothetical protein
MASTTPFATGTGCVAEAGDGFLCCVKAGENRRNIIIEGGGIGDRDVVCSGHHDFSAHTSLLLGNHRQKAHGGSIYLPHLARYRSVYGW